MSERCGCHPGTLDAGWHEIRCSECKQAEVEDFKRCLEAADRIIAEMRGK